MTKVLQKLPLGIQSFEKIRREDYLYVDKTALVWQLVHGSMFNYFSRPRRFGKSLLISTLQCYFEGKKELFDGLTIMDLEHDWKSYPVVRLDMSNAGATADALTAYLHNAFSLLEDEFSIVPDTNTTLAVRLTNILRIAHNKTGLPVVVLVDEYDSPLLNSWQTPQHEECRDIYRNVFSVLKSATDDLQFVFITGVTKFTQVSIFSALNNLTNVSFHNKYAALCGITEEELTDSLMPYVRQMAEVKGWTIEQTIAQLKSYYDGYHFTERSDVGVFNPFSLMQALDQQKFGNFWIASGATKMLPILIPKLALQVHQFDDYLIAANVLETSDVATDDAALFLYQSGYLTIKETLDGMYRLTIPNTEVSQALYEVVLPALTLRENSEIFSEQMRLRQQMIQGDVVGMENVLRSLVADVPYSNKKLSSMDMEERYRLIISSLMRVIGFRVEVERMMAKGRIDIVVWTSQIIYVMELKLTNNGGVSSAEEQIEDRAYMLPFLADGRRIMTLAIELDDNGKGVVKIQTVSDTIDDLSLTAAPQVTPQVTPQVKGLLSVLNSGDKNVLELMDLLKLKDRRNFRLNYLQPALSAGLVAMTIPEKPNSRLQRYRLVKKE